MTDHDRDRKLDQEIGILLRVGVISAVVVILAGSVWHFVQAGSVPPDLSIFHGEAPDLTSVGGILQGVAAGHAASLIQLGLLLLIATPIARVAVCAAGFAAQKDWTYVAITLIVLAALAASLAGI